MKNRVLGTAKAVAAGAVGGVPGSLRERIAEILAQVTGTPKLRHTTGHGYSVAEGKRRAVKHRNCLRARGRYREAVR